MDLYIHGCISLPVKGIELVDLGLPVKGIELQVVTDLAGLLGKENSTMNRSARQIGS